MPALPVLAMAEAPAPGAPQCGARSSQGRPRTARHWWPACCSCCAHRYGGCAGPLSAPGSCQGHATDPDTTRRRCRACDGAQNRWAGAARGARRRHSRRPTVRTRWPSWPPAAAWSARLAWAFRSSPGQDHVVLVPARQAYSHCTSPGSSSSWCCRTRAHSFQLILSTGKERSGMGDTRERAV